MAQPLGKSADMCVVRYRFTGAAQRQGQGCIRPVAHAAYRVDVDVEGVLRGGEGSRERVAGRVRVRRRTMTCDMRSMLPARSPNRNAIYG